MTSQRFAIIGGGFLGMTLAHRLAQQGNQVTLYESAKEPGGLASAWQLGDITWDRHYHVTLMSDLALRGLLAELGLEDELVWKETKTGFYVDGNLYSMSNTLEFLKFPPLRFIDKLRLGGTIFYASKIRNWQRLEKIPVTDWLRKWSGKRTFEKIWLPLLRAKLGENYQKASAAFIWAIIARMYAARRTGLKKEMFGYVKGGYARILERFTEMLQSEGVELKFGQRVQKITSPSEQPIVETDDEKFEYDQVVLTTPSPVALRLCPNLREQEQRKHRDIQYQGIVCASLLIKKPLADYYVTNITDSWVPFTAVIEMSALVDREQLGGNCLIYLPKYVTPDDPMFERSDEEIQEEFVSALEKMYPHFSREEVLAFRISRAKHVLAISTLNYSDNLPPMATSIPGLHIINSAHIVNGTLNVNETIQLAERGLTHLLEHQSRQTEGESSRRPVTA